MAIFFFCAFDIGRRIRRLPTHHARAGPSGADVITAMAKHVLAQVLTC